jgi:hypothetical protein
MKPFLLLFVLIIITSCVEKYDPQFPVYYKVRNNTDSEIKVIYNGVVNPAYSAKTGIPVPDSIIIIASQDEKSLFVTLYTAYEKNNPETEDTIQGFYTLRIYKNDTILSNKYYLLTRYWEYSEPTRTRAELTVTVNADDFNK